MVCLSFDYLCIALFSFGLIEYTENGIERIASSKKWLLFFGIYETRKNIRKSGGVWICSIPNLVELEWKIKEREGMALAY